MVMMASPQYVKGKLYDIPIIDLRPDPDQPRKFIDPDRMRGKQTAGAALCRSLDQTRARVEKTDPATLTDEARQAALDSFTCLREAIENCPNPQAARDPA
jgi:hypothetical protein